MNQRTDRRYFRLLALLGAVALLAGCASHRYEDRYGYDRSYHVDETVYGSGGFSVGASYHRSSYWYDPFWSPWYSFGYSYSPNFYIYRDYYPRYHDPYWNRPSWRHHGPTVWYAPRHPWYGNRRPHSHGSSRPTPGQTAGEATRLTRQPPAGHRSLPGNDSRATGPRIINRAKENNPAVGESTRLTRPAATPSRSTPTVRHRQSDPAPVIRHTPRVSEPSSRSRAPVERPVIHRQSRPDPRGLRPSVDSRSSRSDDRSRYRAPPPQSTRPAARAPQRGSEYRAPTRSTRSSPAPAQRPVQSRSMPVQSRPAPVQRPVQHRPAPSQRPVQRQTAPAQRPSPPPTMRARSSDESDNRSSRRR